MGKRPLSFPGIVVALAKNARPVAVGLLLVFGAAAGISVGCRHTGADSGLSLHLLPDPASCAGVPLVCVSTLHVNLQSGGESLIDKDYPFQVPGGHVNLGGLPHSGTGVFRVAGLNTAVSTVFAGSSGTVTFTDHDQFVDVYVDCASPAPCSIATPPMTVFTSGTNAQLLLGQPDATTCDPTTNGVAADQDFEEPDGIFVLGSNLWIADRANGRTVEYADTNALTGFVNDHLTLAVGHGDTQGQGNNGGQGGENKPRGVWVLPDRLLVGDTSNHRVQEYLPVPATSNQNSDFTIGQNGNGNTNDPGSASATNLKSPVGTLVVGTSLFVADSGFNRVLRYDLATIGANGPTANLVLGQTTFTSNGAGTSQSALSGPSHLATDGRLLWVADTGNNRVLGFQLSTLATGGPAAIVLGQPDFTSNAANRNGSPAADTLAAPRGISAESGRLVVADSLNHRVLIWQPVPDTNGAPANAVLGQVDFATNTANYDGGGGGCPTLDSCNNSGINKHPTLHTMARPGAVWLAGDDLWVSDTCNNRILRFTAH